LSCSGSSFTSISTSKKVDYDKPTPHEALLSGFVICIMYLVLIAVIN
jgi:hypothetical protein